MSAIDNNSFAALRQFVRRPSSVELCELCSRELGPIHQHLLEPINRKLVCACDACAILFNTQGTVKYKRVPRDVRALPDFRLTDSQWDGLMMPINMAFFFRSTPLDRVVALYPSPAGATESLLSFDTWDEIALENPALLEMEADVEALLVNRIGHSRGFTDPEYYIVPIDECFKLVGLIRSHWQGLSGGTKLWQEIGEFFNGLKARSPNGAFHA
ncbi:MAG TPA: DUF5947 family protein [Bryobacteraceae bacterium]|jgi:hypothetical protein